MSLRHFITSPLNTSNQRPATNWLSDLMAVYRLRPHNGRRSSLRILVYPVLGYAMAARWAPRLILTNLAATLGFVLAVRVFNDFWDARLLEEPNRWRRSTGRLARWLSAPLALMTPFYLLLVGERPELHGVYLAFLGAAAGLLTLYSFPPIRLKERPPWGLFVAPLLAAGMFLQASWWLRPPTLPVALVAVLLALFHLHAELLQIVDDHVSRGVAVKLPPERAQRWLRRLPFWHAGAALLCALVHPIFWLGVAGAATRYLAIRHLQPTTISRARTQIHQGLWSLYELAGYAGARLLGAGF